MVNSTTNRPTRRKRWAPTTLLGLAALALGAQAQMGPGGGGPPGGMGGMGPGKGAPSAAEREPQRMPTLEDLMPPDPWRIWLDQLRLNEAKLALTDAQRPAYLAFLRELDESVRLNGQRMQRGMRRTPLAVSATVDVARDLRQEADDARDWQAALDDLGMRWAALAKVLTPAQQGLVDTLYRTSRDMAQQLQKDRPRPPGR
jgi:hypothetical protein